MEADVRITKVDEFETRSGTTRFVIHDDQGREYTTFRPTIGRDAKSFEGKRAHIEYHEQERNGFQNVYLDAVAAAADAGAAPATDTDPEEAAWRTAVEAAPWVLGTSQPDRAIPPDELYEKLEPFKRLVAEDIRDDGEDD
jgi:hypothetical protein